MRDGELLTSEEVAQRLRVSRQSVSRWVREGVLEAKQLPGGRLRFRVEDVEEFLSDKEAS